MGEKIVVGPINKGLKTDREPFNIDNDSFPTLINAYQWRGRIKRKRGTSPINRLKRHFVSTSVSYNPEAFATPPTASQTITLAAVTGAGNLLTGFFDATTIEPLQATGNIVPGSVTITVGINVYTDPAMDGTLSPSGSINYATGGFAIAAEAGNAASAVFNYYPNLPVMGLRDFVNTNSPFPETLAFDTRYAYRILTTEPYNIYDVSFYKNPPNSGTFLPGYTLKTNITPTTWNGQDYQQFWTVNYEGALWATNGINIPFSPSNVGMQYKDIVAVTVLAPVAPSTATVNLEITAHGLVEGDFLFVNEVVTTTGINFQTGYVITVTDANNVIVDFPFAVIATNGTGGIAQYLTNRADPTKDSLRWYDGDPTNGIDSNPTLDGRKGWVNFAPPLSQDNFSIGGLVADKYYLVGARMIVPFKDRLLFIGPVVQTSSAGSQRYLQDVVIYSQNGSPYYTASFEYQPTATDTDPTNPTIDFHPILVPEDQTATASAYFCDSTGFGGFVKIGIDQPINSTSTNEDVLIFGLDSAQVRFVYTGDDIIPFNFFTINSEYGSESTFSTINMDRGVLAKGSRGYIMSNQNETRRFDLEIPDQVFETSLQNNGTQRVCAQRDFINEWVYFTYPSNKVSYKFPNQTLQYNYRDNSWGVFNECYTTYGSFRKRTGFTWATVGTIYPTWSSWNEPWNAGSASLLQPIVIAGNQQGFVLARDDGTNEANSLEISSISFPSTITGATQATQAVLTVNNQFAVGQTITITGVVGMTQLNGNTYTIVAVTPTTVTINVDSTAFGAYISNGVATPPTVIYSPNHTLNNSDFIQISGVLGTVGDQVNGRIFSVSNPTTNGFNILDPITDGTYLGGGLIKRLYRPYIQSKQFPVSWGISRKTRLGVQQYLLTTTVNAEITLLIFLSQDIDSAYNRDPIYPDLNSINDSLVYSTVLYTSPESTNLGLTQANSNLQMPTARAQQQIWHRMNTSLIGDTVQVGFTLNDIQMRSLTESGSAMTITGISQATQAVLTADNSLSAGQLIKITGVAGMTELNENVYLVVSANDTTITIAVDSSGFDPWTSGGTAVQVGAINQFAEIEIHGFILDVSQSQVLA